MFVHLGADVVIPTKEIIAIIDIGLVDRSEITSEFHRVAAEEDFLRDISRGSRRSMVITSRTIYISDFATTLKNRARTCSKTTRRERWDRRQGGGIREVIAAASGPTETLATSTVQPPTWSPQQCGQVYRDATA